MPTGDRRVNLVTKKLIGLTELKTFFLDYLYEFGRRHFKQTFGTPGVEKAVTFGLATADEFDLLPNTVEGFDGLGHLLAGTAALLDNTRFENTATIQYDVGLSYAEVPDNVETNARTGASQYTSLKETIGQTADPTSVTFAGGIITLNVNSVTEASVSNAGRSVVARLKTPKSSLASVAIETKTVTFSSPNNSIALTGLLGQDPASVSVTASDYEVTLLGPRVRRNSSLQNVSGVIFIGKVTGGGAGFLPTSSSTFGQKVYTSGGLGGVSSTSDFLRDVFSNQVLTGGAVSSTGATNITVAGGTFHINGQVVGVNSKVFTGPFTANATMYVRLDVTAVPPDYVALSTLPAFDEESVLLGGAKTDGTGGVTSVVDLRRFLGVLDERLEILVGTFPGLTTLVPGAHFKTIREAVTFIKEVRNPTAGSAYPRSWRIAVVGECAETASSITLDFDALEIVGREGGYVIPGSTTVPLFNLSGTRKDIAIRNLIAFGVTATAEGCVFMGMSASATVDRLELTNIKIGSSKGTCLFAGVFDGLGTGKIIRDSYFENIVCEPGSKLRGHGLRFEQAENVRIHACRLLGNRTTFFGTAGARNAIHIKNTITTKGVTVTDCQLEEWKDHGVFVNTASNSTVTGCQVVTTGRAGILNSAGSQLVIQGNNVSDVALDSEPASGIAIQGGAKSVISGNTAQVGVTTTANSHGILVAGDDNTVVGNLTKAAAGATTRASIRVEGNRNTIIGNVANPDGIFLHTTADRNTVVGNIANTAGITNNGTNNVVASNVIA